MGGSPFFSRCRLMCACDGGAIVGGADDWSGAAAAGAATGVGAFTGRPRVVTGPRGKACCCQLVRRVQIPRHNQYRPTPTSTSTGSKIVAHASPNLTF